ncbi:restriction endonuclease subunit S [Staphylococcus aureus]|uniref:restriction endonuclease subunit S n=1 Tax=Staphylococcus aureus TaxID=1280 RepID=UPI000F1190D2|nr:restriction endonuclease subunit S [Staphylococcus aureus]RLL56501.1 restriction endonuclease subunit S [Staphylococcus aureus]
MKPILRFPEFNEKWEYNLFSEVVTNKSKKFNPKSDEIRQDIELDSIEQNTGRLLNTYISKDFTSQKNKFDNGSVLYSKLRPYLNKYYYAQISGVCSSEIWVLNSLNNQKLSNLFLYFFIQTNRFSNVANKSAGSKMPRADWGLVENVRLYKGSIEEQEKIGNFFRKIDKQIELEENKLKLLEQQKKGYMQKIFLQEMRFKDKNNNRYPDWEIKKLEEIAEFQNGKAHENFVSNTGKFILVNSKFISTESKVKKYVDKQLTPLEINDIAIVMSDVPNGKALAKCYLIEKENVYSLNQRIGRIFNIKGNSKFLYTQINRNKQLLKYDNGVGQTNLKKSEIIGIKIYWPNKEEQDKIGAFFLKLDSIIDKQSTKLELLKHRKKGLLQKMFV